MLTQEIPECPFPGQLKKYAELFEKKVRVMVEEVCVCVCGGGLGRFFSRVGLRMADLNFNHGACYPVWYRCLTKTKRKDTFRSAVIV